MTRNSQPDLVIVGGGVGGVSAALAAARRGRRALLLEELSVLGGQFTTQAVPPDEHPWIEGIGSSVSYRELRRTIREFYRMRYPLNGTAMRDPELNIGNATVTKLAHEPSVARLAILSLLAPHIAAGLIEVRTFTAVTAVAVDGDRVVALETRDLRSGASETIQVSAVLDATESGELLALAKAEHVTGSEAQSETGEPHAGAVADPTNMQAATWAFAIEHRAGEDHTIDRPADFDRWRAERPEFWPGPILGFSFPNPRTLAPMRAELRPNEDSPADRIVADQSRAASGADFWAYRRVLWRHHFEPGSFASDVVIVNWPLNDYFAGPLFGGTPEDDALHTAATKAMSVSLLYWLQTEAPRPDGGTGWPGMRPRPDVTMSADGFALAPYLRESRRARTLRTVVEQDVSLAARGHRGALQHPDSVGVGMYRIDLHPSTGGDNFIDIPTAPFEIPLSALTPVRVQNLFPAAKNIGTTHITNGCYRLHPVEWAIGEASAVFALHTLDHRASAQAVAESSQAVAEIQADLARGGVDLRWPDLRGY